MRVLLVESDRHLSDIIATVLRTDGHQFTAVSRADRARELCRTRLPDVVIADLDQVLAGALDAIPAAGAPGYPAIMLTASRRPEDPEVRRVLSQLQARAFLRKPFSVLDLSDKLSELERVRSASRPRDRAASRGTGPAGTAARDSDSPAVERPPHVKARNAATIGRLWATRRTGIVFIETGSIDTRVVLVQGGPVDALGLQTLEDGLYRGVVGFEDRRVKGVGDWSGLGAVLYRCVRSSRRARFASDNRFRVVVRTPWSEAVDGLPVGAAVRRVVTAADGHLSLGELIARAGVAPDSVSADLHCLRRLRLIDLQQPAHRRPLASSHGAGGLSVSRQRGAGRDRARSNRHGGLAGPGAEHSSIAPDSNLNSGTTTWTGSSGIDLSDQPTSVGFHGGGRARLSASTFRGRHAGDLTTIRRRLQRELSRLRGAPAAVVLGVPASASAEMVDRVAERMRSRYGALAADAALPADVRELSIQVGRLVDQAHRRMAIGEAHMMSDSASASTSAGGLSVGGRSGPQDDRLSAASGVSDHTRPDERDPESLLLWGRRLIAQKDWRRADRVLTQAHKMRIDHVGILSNLGWVRFHNVARPADTRREEAYDYLTLAEQFDPMDAEAQSLLGRFLLEVGQVEAALVRVRRAARLSPEDPAMAALLKTALSRQPGD